MKRKEHRELDGQWLWSEWNHLDDMDARLKNFTIYNGYFATKKDKKYALRVLQLYRDKLDNLKDLCNVIEKNWDNK